MSNHEITVDIIDYYQVTTLKNHHFLYIKNTPFLGLTFTKCLLNTNKITVIKMQVSR